MQNGTNMGMNRTGMAVSPVQGKELVASVNEGAPSSEGNEELIAQVRSAYGEEGEPVGHVPPPVTMKGALGTMAKAATGASISVLMDKLGERLAFERSGTRLYQALIAKFDESESFEGGPSRENLVRFRDQEHAHFLLVKKAIETLGGDPKVVTPSADIAGVKSMGLPQVMNDPRTTFAQCLEVILVAELADNDGWMLLIDLARKFGYEGLAESFELALTEEAVHLGSMRLWVSAALDADTKLLS